MSSLPTGVELVAAPTEEPISLDLACNQLRLDSDTDDMYWLERIGVPAVRRNAEQFTGLALAQATYRLTADAFASSLELPLPPLVSITSVKYDDADGVEQTVAGTVYGVDVSRTPGVLSLKAGQSWPATSGLAGSVRITFVAGYSRQTIPPDLVSGMLLLLGHLYRNREAADKGMEAIPFGYDWLVRPYRIRLGLA